MTFLPGADIRNKLDSKYPEYFDTVDLYFKIYRLHQMCIILRSVPDNGSESPRFGFRLIGKILIVCHVRLQFENARLQWCRLTKGFLC